MWKLYDKRSAHKFAVDRFLFSRQQVKYSFIMNYALIFKLTLAERDDIPRLAHIHVIACLLDNAFGLYFTTLTEFEKEVTYMLESQVGDPTWQHLKVMNKKTGVLAAWASWNTLTDAQIWERDEKIEARIANFEKDKDKGEFDFSSELLIYVQENTERWLEKWTCGKRHMLCKALFTEPFFQRQSMRTALIKYDN